MENLEKIKATALKYLGYTNQQIDNQTNIILEQCLKEIKEITPKIMYQTYHLTHNPLIIKELDLNINYPDLIELFKECNKVVIIACTLGIEIEQKIRYLAKIDITKMTIFDAIASSYLEYKCDEFESLQDFKKRTFRFCPGYGNVPLVLNKILANQLDCYKHIGLIVQENNLLLPQKSMIGLIGLGDQKLIKQCNSCFNIKNCVYLKRGQKCY